MVASGRPLNVQWAPSAIKFQKSVFNLNGRKAVSQPKGAKYGEGDDEVPNYRAYGW
jgi:hypothetical protein